MAIRSRSVKPVTITNESGQPEIVLEIDGLTLSMTPPTKDDPDASAPSAEAPKH
jgi:hypothetical protein